MSKLHPMTKKMTGNRASVLALSFIMPWLAYCESPAFAEATIASPSVGQGVIVSGSCSMSKGNGIDASGLTVFNNTLNDAVKKVSDSITTLQTADTQQFVQLQSQFLTSYTAAKKQISNYKATQGYLNQTTGINALSGGEGGCLTQSSAKNLQEALKSTQVVKQKIMTAATPEPVESSTASIEKINSMQPSDYATDNVIPLPGGPAVDQKKASDAIQMLVMPLPPVATNSLQKLTPSYEKYKAAYNELQAKQSLPTESLAFVAANNVASMDASFAKDQWSQNGMQGPVPGLSQDGSQISVNGFMDVLSRTRYSSAVFNDLINSKGRSWQIKQYAIQLATQLAIENEQLKLMERIVALKAAETAAKVTASDNSVNALRGNAISQSQLK